MLRHHSQHMTGPISSFTPYCITVVSGHHTRDQHGTADEPGLDVVRPSDRHVYSRVPAAQNRADRYPYDLTRRTK